jgi:hypothetical protein
MPSAGRGGGLLSGLCPAFVRPLSGLCPAFVRAFVRPLSGPLSGLIQLKAKKLLRAPLLGILPTRHFAQQAELHELSEELVGGLTLPAVKPASLVEPFGGPIRLFEEVFHEVERRLPSQTKLPAGKLPLVCLTPVRRNADGTLHHVTVGRDRYPAQLAKGACTRYTASSCQRGPSMVEPKPGRVLCVSAYRS